MRPSRFLKGLPWGGVLLVSVIICTTRPAESQVLDTPRFGIGYVANAPDQMAGVGGYFLLPFWGGIGLYVDGKVDLDNPSDDRAFREGVTSADLEAEGSLGIHYISKEKSWRSVNVAVVRPLNPFLMVYAGGGYAQGERYKLYEEITGEVGRALWVRDPDEDEDRVNMMFGLILRMLPMISTQVGVETQPRGFTAGISLRLPPW